MPADKQDDLSYEDDLAADALAAFKEVSAKGSETTPSPQPAPEPAAETVEAEPVKAEGDGRERDEAGRFKAKDEKATEAKPTETPTEQPVVAKPTEQPVVEQPAAPVGGPPSSWSIKAKAAWDQLPDAIKAEVAKREAEVSQGFGALKDYKELKPYADRAQREGTTISKALDYYVRMDDALRRDLSFGVSTIVQNAGYNQQQAAQFFATLAERYGASPHKSGGQSNGQAPANGAEDPLHGLLRPMIEPLMQEVRGLRDEFGNRLKADRNAHAHTQAQAVERAIEAFRSKPEHRYYAEVEQDVAFLFESGRVPKTGDHAADLKTAYDLAVRMHPDIQQALIEQRLVDERASQRKKEQEAADKAKQASRSVTGNRTPGMTVKEVQASNGHDDVEADARAAYRAHMQA